MESWVNQHKTVIERVTGWSVDEKDATDDRIGRLAQVFGESDEYISEFQLQMGQGIICAYQLPTKIVRYDTTAFNVYHDPEKVRTVSWDLATAKITVQIFFNSNKVWQHWTRPEFQS